MLLWALRLSSLTTSSCLSSSRRITRLDRLPRPPSGTNMFAARSPECQNPCKSLNFPDLFKHSKNHVAIWGWCKVPPVHSFQKIISNPPTVGMCWMVTGEPSRLTFRMEAHAKKLAELYPLPRRFHAIRRERVCGKVGPQGPGRCRLFQRLKSGCSLQHMSDSTDMPARSPPL